MWDDDESDECLAASDVADLDTSQLRSIDVMLSVMKSSGLAKLRVFFFFTKNTQKRNHRPKSFLRELQQPQSHWGVVAGNAATSGVYSN